MLKLLAISLPSDKFSLSTIRLILEDPQVPLSLTNGFSVFQNFLLSVMSLIFKLSLFYIA